MREPSKPVKLISKIFHTLMSFIKKGITDYEYKVGKNHSKKIIFILPSGKHQSGGSKVSYRQSEIITKLSLNGISGVILHPQNLSFKHTWFEHDAIFKQSLDFDPHNDFVVVPEVWVIHHAKMLHDIKIKYAIYVQNGYSISVPAMAGYHYDEIRAAYDNASLVLSISEDTTNCIKLAFPSLKTEIIRMYCSVDLLKFNANASKENLITYMPRKLENHSKTLLFFLTNSLPKNWKIKAINGLSEDGVIEILGRSKIFLSFSEFEGFGLPPIEAALSGNQVIGYTGEAAKEYWDLPVFTEIFCGDIQNFVKQILNKIKELEGSPLIDLNSIKVLAEKYSIENEIAGVEKFVIKVNDILNSKN